MRSLYTAMLLAFLPSPIRIAYYKLIGAKIGKNVKIRLGTILIANQIEIGDHSEIGYFCRIKVNKISLGKYVSIKNFVKINVYKVRMDSRVIVSSTVQIDGDNTDDRSVIELGVHSWLFQRCYINVNRPVTLGRNVGIGGGTYLFTHGYWLSKLDGFPVNYAPVLIKDNVWIPWDCFIMPGVKIGKNVVIGARSLVNKDVPENALIAGSPAKIIRDRSYRDVDNTEKIEIIAETIMDFAVKKNKTYVRSEANEKIEFSLEGETLVILYRNTSNHNMVLSQTALNVFLNSVSIDILERYPSYSLYDYASSSVDIMPDLAKDWLQFTRYIGLRFYAIDEV